VAWYGNRQCIWLSQDSDEAFYDVHDYLKHVRALYLTDRTVDGRLLSEMVAAGKNSWGVFVVETLLASKIPKTFPLKFAAPGPFVPAGQLFITDSVRWPATDETPRSLPAR
jgi:hypothetical protein